MIDMHCHLDLYAEPQNVVNNCKEKEIYVLSVTTTPKAWSGTRMIVEGIDKIWTSLGLHPQLAHERYNELEIFDDILPDTTFIGEVGLDGGKNYRSHYKRQKEVFRHILMNVQRAGGRIMTIHSQHAASDVLDELADYPDAGIPILHWFTGNKYELKEAILQECWFSVGPAMLATQRGRELFINIPRDKIISETDGPFAMVNKKPLMPWDVDLVISAISKLWDESDKSVKEKISNNFSNLIKYSKKVMGAGVIFPRFEGGTRLK
jgi:TatD DNase family protein